MRHPSADAPCTFLGAMPVGRQCRFAKSAINGTFRGKRPSTAILGLMAHKKTLCLIHFQAQFCMFDAFKTYLFGAFTQRFLGSVIFCFF